MKIPQSAWKEFSHLYLTSLPVTVQPRVSATGLCGHGGHTLPNCVPCNFFAPSRSREVEISYSPSTADAQHVLGQGRLSPAHPSWLCSSVLPAHLHPTLFIILHTWGGAEHEQLSEEKKKTKMKRGFKPLQPHFFRPQRSSTSLSMSPWSWEDVIVPPMQAAEPSHKKRGKKILQTPSPWFYFSASSCQESSCCSRRSEGIFSPWIALTRGCRSPALQPKAAASSRSRAGCPGAAGRDRPLPRRSHSPSLRRFHLLPGGAVLMTSEGWCHTCTEPFLEGHLGKKCFPCRCSVISINYQGL